MNNHNKNFKFQSFQSKTVALDKLKIFKPKELLLYLQRENLESAFELIEKRIKFSGQWGIYKKLADQYFLKIKEGMKLVCSWENSYPIALKSIPDRPAVIFYEGDNSALKVEPYKLIAIVGTRRASNASLDLAKKIANFLARNGYLVVSGLAMGIDEASLCASSDTKSASMAVIPGDPKIPKPRINTYLFNKIIGSGGLVISESDAKNIAKYDFPKRNRIIAGITRATIVVEAPLKSGALITAKQAYSYGREVFTLPGSIHDNQFVGNNYLIKSNIAQAITKADDLGYFFPEMKLEQTEYKRNSKIKGIELQIYDALRERPMTLNELCSKFDKSASAIISLVSNLELRSMLRLDARSMKYSVLINNNE